MTGELGARDFEADHTCIPPLVRRFAKGIDPEDIVAAFTDYLHEVGLKDHIIVRFRRHRSGKPGSKGALVLDPDGWPICDGFIPFSPTRVTSVTDGITLTSPGQRQVRAFQKQTIRNVHVANHVLSLLEADAGVISDGIGGLRRPDATSPSSPARTRSGKPLTTDPSAPPSLPAAASFDELIAVMREQLPPTSRSVATIDHMREFTARVVDPVVDYRVIDPDGWQTLYDETTTLQKIHVVTRTPVVDASGKPVIVSIDYANGIWDGVCNALEFARKQRWLTHNPARLVERRRRRGERNLGRPPYTLTQTRTLELTAQALGEAARDAVRDDLGPQVRLPYRGRLPSRSHAYRIFKRVTLPNGEEVALDFSVVALAGVPIVFIDGCRYGYYASALELLLLMRCHEAPRISEALAVCESAVDAAALQVAWERRRLHRSGKSQLNGRAIATLQYGTKGSREGDPLRREQPLDVEVGAAYQRWMHERRRLIDTLGWLLPEAAAGGVIFPSVRGGVLSATIARDLVHAVQRMARLPKSTFHRARHGLHLAHEVVDVPVETTAKHLGQTVATAFAYYRMVTDGSEQLSRQGSAAWRELADEGLDDNQIRVEMRARARLGTPVRPHVISTGSRVAATPPVSHHRAALPA